MPGMKVCLHPGCTNVQKESYCQEHQRKRYVSASTPENIARRKRPQRKDTRTNRGQQYGRQYRQLRKRFIDVWIANVGLVCPGYGRPAHRVERQALSTDHIVPIAHGGQHTWENLQVLCLSCNARKRDTIDTPRGR